MKLWVGTSGWSYKEWKGSFYPEDLAASKFLTFYADHFGAVEVNNTFYRLPKREMLEGWNAQTGEDFRFILKASQRITHKARLGEDGYDALGYLIETSEALGIRRGPFLFQTPPWLKKDLDVLKGFLGQIPSGVRAAFEFRSTSWFDDEVFEVLRGANAALVVADTGNEEKDPPFVATADWGYLRLRREAYEDGGLDEWAGRVKGADWTDAHVFFKHEDEGTGPKLARRFLNLFEGNQ